MPEEWGAAIDRKSAALVNWEARINGSRWVHPLVEE